MQADGLQWGKGSFVAGRPREIGAGAIVLPADRQPAPDVSLQFPNSCRNARRMLVSDPPPSATRP
jgi:hypothetical protein